MPALANNQLIKLSKLQTKQYVFDSVDDYINAHSSNKCIEAIVDTYKEAAADAGYSLHDDLQELLQDYRNKLEAKEIIHHFPTFTDQEKELINRAARKSNMGYLQFIRYATLKSASHW
jgi:hypothetical protein